MPDWINVGRPGAIGSRKAEVLANYDQFYGRNNWQLIWDVDGTALDLNGALILYEDAYFEYFRKNPEELKWIADNFADVCDNNPSNVNSGWDYSLQESESHHFQDIAIRRCLIRNGLWFKGKDLLEVRIGGKGEKWDPGRIPFHKPEWIMVPELKGWWKPDSIESFYQSCRYLEAKSRVDLKDAYLINSERPDLAKLLGDDFSLGQISLDISEDKDSIHKILDHKARVAYSVLCLPVICDYTGKRNSLEQKCSSIYALAYFEDMLPKPKIFISKAENECVDTNNLAENCWKKLAEYFISKDIKEQKVINPHCVCI